MIGYKSEGEKLLWLKKSYYSDINLSVAEPKTTFFYKDGKYKLVFPPATLYFVPELDRYIETLDFTDCTLKYVKSGSSATYGSQATAQTRLYRTETRFFAPKSFTHQITRFFNQNTISNSSHMPTCISERSGYPCYCSLNYTYISGRSPYTSVAYDVWYYIEVDSNATDGDIFANDNNLLLQLVDNKIWYNKDDTDAASNLTNTAFYSGTTPIRIVKRNQLSNTNKYQYILHFRYNTENIDENQVSATGVIDASDWSSSDVYTHVYFELPNLMLNGRWNLKGDSVTISLKRAWIGWEMS